MLGEVGEFVSDWFEETGYPKQKKNPTGPEEGLYKVAKGGTNPVDGEPPTVFSRRKSNPHVADNDIGFRCAMDVPK